MSELRNLQKAFTEHLRNPDQVPIPPGLDKRRVGIYSELIFNNVSGLLSDFFPVIHGILNDSQWHRMVRDFFTSHQSQTPYFMEIAEEFVEYLTHSQLLADLPGFLPELAHYEWMELALFTLDEELPGSALPAESLAETPLALSALARPLAYQYPVHRISTDLQPASPGTEPTLLLILRDIEENVRFFELQTLAFQLLTQIQQQPGLVPVDWLSQAADQLGVVDKVSFIQNGSGLLASFNDQRIFTATGR